MTLHARDGYRTFYVLMNELLAKLYVTDTGAEQGGGFLGDEWVVSTPDIWIWRGLFLPDGVDDDRLVAWEPFYPPDHVLADFSLAMRIIDVVHPALVWWPDRVDHDAEIGSAEPPRSQPHLIRYSDFTRRPAF